MIRSLTTMICGIAVAVLIVTVAVFAAVYVIGFAAKAALFGEPRATLAMKVLQRATKGGKTSYTDITGNTDNSGGTNETNGGREQE